MAEEEVVVTGVMRGGVRMGTIGGTQEREVEEQMEVVLLEVVEEVVRGGVAVVAEEETNTFRLSLNDAVEVEEVQEVGVMDKTGVELQSLQVQDTGVPGSRSLQIGMTGSPRHQHQQQPPQRLQYLHVVKARRLRGLHQVRPLVNPNL